LVRCNIDYGIALRRQYLSRPMANCKRGYHDALTHQIFREVSERCFGAHT
jgi:hypothetical protein